MCGGQSAPWVTVPPGQSRAELGDPAEGAPLCMSGLVWMREQAHSLHQALCSPDLDQLELHLVWAAQQVLAEWDQVLFHLCPALGKVVGLFLPSMVLEFSRFFASQSLLQLFPEPIPFFQHPSCCVGNDFPHSEFSFCAVFSLQACTRLRAPTPSLFTVCLPAVLSPCCSSPGSLHFFWTFQRSRGGLGGCCGRSSVLCQAGGVGLVLVSS